MSAVLAPLDNAMLEALRDRRMFIVYRLEPRSDGRADKIPTDPATGRNSDAQDPATWMLPHEAQAHAQRWGAGHGVGIVLHEGCGLFCVDIDHAYDHSANQWSATAESLFQRFAGCAIEVSVSGHGAHIFGRYTGTVRHGSRNSAHRLELYTRQRFIAITGTSLVGNVLHDATAPLQDLIGEYFPAPVLVPPVSGPVPDWSGPADDDALIEKALSAKESAGAIFGDKASFTDLWTGNADALQRAYSGDESMADMALAQHLAFWTGNDQERMLRLMARSGLARPKWDRHDYLPRTVERACSRQTRWYKAPAATAPPPPAVPALPAPVARFTLCTGEELAARIPARQRIKGVLPERGLAALYGPSGSGKTFLALDMLGAIAQGSDWFGRRVHVAPVLYVALEGEAGVAQRVRAYAKRYGMPPMRFLIASLDLRRSDELAALVEAVRASGWAGDGVVALDTLNASVPGADENSSADMGHAIGALKWLQRELGGLVLVVHHTGKDVTKGLRGHSSLIAALDAAIEVSRDADRRAWRIAKAKDGADGEEMAFALEIATLGTDEDGDPITSATVRALDAPALRRPEAFGGNQRTVWDTLRPMLSLRPEGVTVEDAVEAARGKLSCEPRRQGERIRAAITALVTRNLITINGGVIKQRPVLPVLPVSGQPGSPGCPERPAHPIGGGTGGITRDCGESLKLTAPTNRDGQTVGHD